MIAGVGNILVQDDGFGTEVIRNLSSKTLPTGVEVEDFGVASMRMAHRLMEGYDLLIIADIAKRGGKPGTLYVIEIQDPGNERQQQQQPQQSLIQGSQMQNGLSTHTMGSDQMLSLIRSFNAWPKKVLLVCCEPLLYEEYAIGLSEPVQNAVNKAVEVIQSIIAKELNGSNQH